MFESVRQYEVRGASEITSQRGMRSVFEITSLRGMYSVVRDCEPAWDAKRVREREPA
ncbi:hypothetical protein [Paenibacillus sp. F411]|uniref:hypothetical protein n=1 Tax=Paenibacillus sp. F411 TaxID=2820239 RepID=UPI001AAFDFC3|nr:hypothetical protein [Paenibacillus sp. F411]